MSSRFGFLSVVFFAWFVVAAGCGGGDNGNPPPVPPPPPPTPAPAAIVLDGIVSDSPVVAGWIYVFSSAEVNAALDDANTAEDRRSALGDANPIVVFQRDAGDEDSFEFEVPGGRAGEVVFLIFDNADARDEEFGDAPVNVESVVVLGDEGTSQRVNLSLHATLISQQVRAGLASEDDVGTIEAEIAAAEMNVLNALGEGVDGEPLYPTGESPLDTEDDELVHAASSLVGLMARTIAALEDVALDEVVAALAADAADGAVDGNIPAPFDPSDEQQELADAANELLSRGEDDDVAMMAVGPCSSSAVALWQACDIDVLDDFFEGRAICADISDEESRGECIAEVEFEAAETDEECDEVFEARLGLCENLEDAAHEPEFGEEFAANFVDPLQIGVSVVANPYFPLVQGNTWTYEGTFLDDDDEEVTEIITVTVTDRIKLIQGIWCLVVNDLAEEDGEKIENTDDWFAQDVDGNVWYCGEIAENFETFEGDNPEEPELVDIEGSWKAGREGSKAGMLIPFAPVIGDIIRQEVAYGEAEDVVEIVSLTESESSPAASCIDTCLHTIDSSPLEPDVAEDKYYVPGVGLIVESDAETGERVELVEFTTL